MGHELESVLRALYGAKKPQPTECQAYADVLDAYVEAELDGRDADGIFLKVAAHLSTCASCQEEYQDLRFLQEAQRQRELPASVDFPELNYDYLEQPTSPSIWQRVEELGQVLLRMVEVVQIRISETASSFGDLPTMLAPQPVAVAATRSGQPGEAQEQEELTLPVPTQGISIKIRPGAVQMRAVPVTFTLEDASTKPPRPISRTRVTVREQAGNILNSDLTDPQGQVHFDPIQPGAYLVEVKYKGETLQIPLPIILIQEQ